MTKKIAPTKKAATRKRIPSELKINRREEWRLDLPLSAEIQGKLPHGEKFREETKLENISSGGAYFCLDSGVVVGSKLNLIFELPAQLTDGRKMKMRLGGITIRLEKPDRKTKKQGVAVRFSKDFRIMPEAAKKKNTKKKIKK
ncbi:MAG: PilZ domain-containing protein [Candidatus Aminicenantales bacterium]